MGNIFACAGRADGDLAISIGEPHASWRFDGNAVLRCPEWLRSAPASAIESGEDATVSVAVAVDGQSGGDRQKDGQAGGGGGAPYPHTPGWLLWWKVPA